MKLFNKTQLLLVLILCMVFTVAGAVIGFSLKSKSENKKTEIKQKVITEEIYPACLAGKCPNYFGMSVRGDMSPLDTVIIIPTAMTQGAGKLVIVDEDGNKLFDSGEEPSIWVKPVSDGNGFIMKYSTPMDENLKRKNYEARYKYENGKFVNTDTVEVKE